MAQTPKIKKDTTVVKTPYKVKLSELAKPKVVKKSTGTVIQPRADSTVKKITYNMGEVQKSLTKRNTERVANKQKEISKNDIFGTGRKDVRESTKGKNYKK